MDKYYTQTTTQKGILTQKSKQVTIESRHAECEERWQIQHQYTNGKIRGKKEVEVHQTGVETTASASRQIGGGGAKRCAGEKRDTERERQCETVRDSERAVEVAANKISPRPPPSRGGGRGRAFSWEGFAAVAAVLIRIAQFRVRQNAGNGRHLIGETRQRFVAVASTRLASAL